MVHQSLNASFSLDRAVAEEIRCPDCLKLFSYYKNLQASIEVVTTQVQTLQKQVQTQYEVQGTQIKEILDILKNRHGQEAIRDPNIEEQQSDQQTKTTATIPAQTTMSHSYSSLSQNSQHLSNQYQRDYWLQSTQRKPLPFVSVFPLKTIELKSDISKRKISSPFA